jgi:hypothetical protein
MFSSITKLTHVLAWSTHLILSLAHIVDMLQLLQGHVSSKDAHEMMMFMVMPCYDHAQMMPKCKANTWGVIVMNL